MVWRGPIAALALACLLAAPVRAGEPLPAARPETVGFAPDRIERLHRGMQAFIDREELMGMVMLVARNGKRVDWTSLGYRDRKLGQSMRPDAIFRIASMTKPVTSVAVLLLLEEGRLLLTDPVSRYLPELGNRRVLVRQKGQPDSTIPAQREITIRDLLTHRSGIVYGFGDEPVAERYRALGVSDGLSTNDVSAADNLARLARAPLCCQPGREWHYGLSADVLGYLVEAVAKQPLDQFLQERVFRPLGMVDTGFVVPPEKWGRVATVYTARAGGGLREMADPETFDRITLSPVARFRAPGGYASGGAGLVSTASDYARFLEMLLEGGQLGGVRLLSRKTVELMTSSATADLTRPMGEDGGDFGLGVRVVTDLGASWRLGSAGAYSWGGIYGTSFFVDPKEKLVAVFMTQRFPFGDLNWGDRFQTLVYQAITR
jgi:CubicO group peptidase (beta-lactamase class C family)